MMPPEKSIVAKIEELMRIPWTPIHGSDKAIPIQVGRLFFDSRRNRVTSRFHRAVRCCRAAAIGPPRTDKADFAELVRFQILITGLNVMRSRALLRAHLADPVVHASRLDDRRPFFNLER
jgi:hypothetical protein